MIMMKTTVSIKKVQVTNNITLKDLTLDDKHNVLRKIIICSLLAMLSCIIIVPTVYAWDTNVHKAQALSAAEYMGVDTNYWDIIGKGSVAPDIEFDYLDTTIYPNELSQLYHSIRHSYLPEVAIMPNPVSSPYELTYQNAAAGTAWNANIAKHDMAYGNKDEAYKYLGYSMHYMTDSACPAHSSVLSLLPCYNNPYKEVSKTDYLHDTYEYYVFFNWNLSIEEGVKFNMGLIDYVNGVVV